MSQESGIRRLIPIDATALMTLRVAALRSAPLAFGSSPTDDRLRSREFVDGMLNDSLQQAVFGWFETGQLAGMVGVQKESRAKERHKASLWGMYVSPAARRKGIGRALLDNAIAHAAAWPDVRQLHLSVTDAACEARLLYEASGFRCWGQEPRALAWQGGFVDEIHMVLEIR